MRAPLQVEGIAVQHQGNQLAPERRQQAAGRTQQAELDPPRLDQQWPRCAQRTQQGALADALVQRCLQASEQHRQPGCQHEQQHILDRQGHLGEDAAQLIEQGVHLQDGHCRECP
ncbi:Uncharacterised protein [Pseudomonas putida]|nr:Uncharacterised protein [Pseudomonas putida]